MPTCGAAPSSSSLQVPIIQVPDKTSARRPSTHSHSPDIGDRADAGCAANQVLAQPSSPRSSGLTHERTHPALATPGPSLLTALLLSNRSRNSGVKVSKKRNKKKKGPLQRCAVSHMLWIRSPMHYTRRMCEVLANQTCNPSTTTRIGRERMRFKLPKYF